METDKNYFLVGIFVIATILAGIGFTLWLTYAGKGEMTPYLVRFTDPVDGLKKGGAVKFQGVDVGTVEAIILNPQNTQEVRVEIKILKKTPVKTSTIAFLEPQALTGNVYVELSGGKPNEPNLTAAKDEIPEIKAGPSHTLNAFMDRLHPLFGKMNHVAGQMGKLFSDQNVQSVNKAVNGIAKTFGEDDEKPKEEKPALARH